MNRHKPTLANLSLSFSLPFALSWMLLISFSGLTPKGYADSSAKLTARDYGALPARQSVTISPEGDKIAFRAVEDGRDLVIVYSLAKKKMLTGIDVSETIPQYLHFVRNDLLVMVASEIRRVWGYRGKNEISTAFSLNTQTKKVQQLLTPGDEISAGQTGLGRIVGLSEDQKYVYMPAFLEGGKRALMKVDLKRPRRPRTAYNGHFDVIDFFVDEEGDILAQVRYDNEENTYSIQVPDGWGWKPIHEHETPLIDMVAVGLTPDRQSLVILTENPDTGRNDYFKLSLSNGSIGPMGANRNDVDVSGVITDLNRVVHGLRYAGFTPGYELFDPELNQRVQAVQQTFKGHAVRLADWTQDWKYLVFYVEGPGSSGDYYLHTSDEGLSYLAAARPNIPAKAIHPVTQFDYQARDGLTIPALLTLPLSQAHKPEKLPGIVLPHGGPHAYDKMGFDWLAQALAEQGYLVVQPQFRGSVGFGRELWEAGLGEWGGRMQDDLTDAINVLTKVGMLDPSQVCIVGGSYGGYAALAGASMTPDLYRCAVSINGVSDLNKMLESDREQLGRDHWVLSYFRQSLGDKEFSQDKLERISPSNLANQVKAPILLIHAENDSRVSVNQSKLMYDRLEKAGKLVEFVELEGDNHNLMRGPSRLKTLERLLSFLDQHLGGDNHNQTAME